ncbi:hypothetical protein J3459_010924 [Metarhizium acridum]|uniref:uncharacterized protein n=1 Tax=Metarhizium acridum TaxID=92637 RepID=UPI001C6AE92D|nr:hypothetical protein J3458_019631 [Metarhizium acridum]KAG8420600.1 hypothetical protein J3459_010924 [Metarhizium acridum]
MSYVPPEGLSDISFPINLSRAPHVAGYHFAQRVKFNGQYSVAYAGLQPREDSQSGAAILRGVFSSFIHGTTTTDPNCSDGADGGQGVSCAYDFSGSYTDTWDLIITNTAGTTWAGKAVNYENGTAHHIGTFTLPAGTGGIQGSQVGFMDYFPWNTNLSMTCADLPPTECTFSAPTTGSSSNGYSVGSVSGSVERCENNVEQKPTLNEGVRFAIF